MTENDWGTYNLNKAFAEEIRFELRISHETEKARQIFGGMLS